jgi:hypothetical protein
LAKSNITIDTYHCLKEPNVVDKTHYDTLITLVLSLFYLSFLQAYIKRFRIIIAGCIYPERDKERAIWLYNHILLYKSKIIHWLKYKLTIEYDNYSKFNPIPYMLSLLKWIIG